MLTINIFTWTSFFPQQRPACKRSTQGTRLALAKLFPIRSQCDVFQWQNFRRGSFLFFVFVVYCVVYFLGVLGVCRWSTFTHVSCLHAITPPPPRHRCTTWPSVPGRRPATPPSAGGPLNLECLPATHGGLPRLTGPLVPPVGWPPAPDADTQGSPLTPPLFDSQQLPEGLYAKRGG